MLEFETESALAAAAATAAASWREAGLERLTIGLVGDLGVGKTAWARALLRGLGYAGRVPSPTYTLLEQYDAGGQRVVHIDLYRLAEPHELEFLGIRDWLAADDAWILVEWPERSPALAGVLDLSLTLSIGANDVRQLRPVARSARGQAALEAWLGPDIK